jgi:hypothetical protein
VKALLVALLLVLAISPLTAPFSIQSPLDVLGDVTSWTTPKKLADDLKTDAIPSAPLELPGVDWSLTERLVAPSPARTRKQDSYPLRV